METKFVTLTSEDKDFDSYLKGTFSGTHRAVPINSWNISTKRERVTFRVFSVKDQQTPSGVKVLWKGIRPELLSLSMGPYLTTLFFFLSAARSSFAFDMLLAPLSLFFLHASVFLLNDYYDHLRGVDRINRLRGSQIIQLGWVPAFQVRNWAWVSLALAALTGLPVLVAGPPLLWGISVLALFGIVGFSFLGRLVKHRGWGDALIFLCFGPLITVGVVAMEERIPSVDILKIGIIFGLMALLVFHIRQFETLMRDSQENALTSMSRWGFDRGKRYISAEYVALIALSAWSFFEYWPLALLLVGMVSGLWWNLIQKVRSLRSPLSSDLQGLGLRAARCHIYTAAVIFALLMLDRWWPEVNRSFISLVN